MKHVFNSKFISTMMLTSTLLNVSCGDRGKDDNTIILIPDNQLQQRQEGTVPTGPSVVVNNNIDNDVKVINKNIRVVEKNLVIKYRVVNVDPVLHQQFIFAAVDCSGIHNDVNGDGLVDQAELEEAVGSPVATLAEAQGSDFMTDQRLPVAELPADQTRFALVVFGSNEGTSIPVICNSFTVNHATHNNNNPPITTTTATTSTTPAPTTTPITPLIGI